MVKSTSQSVGGPGTLKSSPGLTSSKPDKDKDADKDKKLGTERSGVSKSGRTSVLRQVLSRRDLKMLKKAKSQGGQAWEQAKAQVRLRLTPAEHKSKSIRANTAMPVNKLKRRIVESVPKNRRATTEAAVALAAVLDYVTSELIDNAAQACEVKKQRTIIPRHVKLGVPQDESLAQLFKGVTIPQGGTVPVFHPELAMGYKRATKRRAATADDYASKELSSPNFQDGFKSKKDLKHLSEAKPTSSDDDLKGSDAKKDKPGHSSSPSEKGIKDHSSSPPEK